MEPDSNLDFEYSVVKVELKEDHVQNFQEQDLPELSDSSDLKFTDAEVTTDPQTGQSVCMLCLQKLQPESVTDHMITVHKFRKVHFKCWNCDTIFKLKTDLVYHRQTCQPRKTRKSTGELIQEVTEKFNATVCPICMIELTEVLEVHLQKEHNIPEKPPVICDDCQKSFRTKVGLRSHIINVHLAKKQTSVNCHVCGQQYASQKYLDNHLRNVHPTDGKVHPCSRCPKCFKSRHALHQHTKYVHLGFTRPPKNRNKKKYYDDD